MSDLHESARQTLNDDQTADPTGARDVRSERKRVRSDATPAPTGLLATLLSDFSGLSRTNYRRSTFVPCCGNVIIK